MHTPPKTIKAETSSAPVIVGTGESGENPVLVTETKETVEELRSKLAVRDNDDLLIEAKEGIIATRRARPGHNSRN